MDMHCVNYMHMYSNTCYIYAHWIFQDVPYLDIGTLAPQSRSRGSSVVEDDRVSLCSMDSIASSSIGLRQVRKFNIIIPLIF